MAKYFKISMGRLLHLPRLPHTSTIPQSPAENKVGIVVDEIDHPLFWSHDEAEIEVVLAYSEEPCVKDQFRLLSYCGPETLSASSSVHDSELAWG